MKLSQQVIICILAEFQGNTQKDFVWGEKKITKLQARVPYFMQVNKHKSVITVKSYIVQLCYPPKPLCSQVISNRTCMW